MKRNQYGVAHLALIAFSLVILGAVALAGWKVVANNKNPGSPSKNSASTKASSANLEAECQKAVNDVNICKFASHYDPQTAYKAVDTSATTEGSGTLTILSDGKGNSSVTSSYNGSDSSYVSLNGATYIKNAGGGWTKYSASSATAPSTTNPADNFKISFADITDNGTVSYKALSTEACGSQTCYKYQVVDASQPDTTQYVWFDNKNYQLQEYYVKNANGSNDIKFSYSAVSISVPSPITQTI